MNHRFRKQQQQQQQRQDESSSLSSLFSSQQSTATWANMDTSTALMTVDSESTFTFANSASRNGNGNGCHRVHQNADGTTTVSFSKECYVDIARAMEQNLDIRNRKYHLKTYKDCFVGSEAVDFLLEYLQLPNRQTALRVGQEMNLAINCLEHVVHDHNDQLKDEYLFYRFTTNYYHANRRRTFTLLEVMRAFQMGVKVQDRTYHLRTYPNVFVGSEAVDFLVHYKFAASRGEAIQLGRKLQEEYELFVHVTEEHPLEDDYIFYRMLVPKIGKSKQVKELERKALKQWIYVFSFVAILIYYYLF